MTQQETVYESLDYVMFYEGGDFDNLCRHLRLIGYNKKAAEKLVKNWATKRGHEIVTAKVVRKVSSSK